MATAAVRISALRKEFPGRGGRQPVVAVDGIDVEIAAGEIVGPAPRVGDLAHPGDG